MAEKICTKCAKLKPTTDFYKDKTHAQKVMCYCKDCFNNLCIERWINRKIQAIKYKGSQCEKCNLKFENSHYSVFEFHHNNPKEKDYDWTKLRLRSWNSIKTELDKCKLVCANCHRLIHAVEFPEQLKSQ